MVSNNPKEYQIPPVAEITQLLTICYLPGTRTSKVPLPNNQHDWPENPPLEDAFPIETGDVPVSHVSQLRGVKIYIYIHIQFISRLYITQ